MKVNGTKKHQNHLNNGAKMPKPMAGKSRASMSKKTDQDRIKLAEAMGWTCHATGNKEGRVWMPPDFGDFFDKRDAVIAPCLPNPFTDANDDYAVLEWINSHTAYSFRQPYWEAMTHRIWSYRVGDYARAVLAADASAN